MSDFDSMMGDVGDVLLEHQGESVTYLPRGGGTRVITAVVHRDPPQPLPYTTNVAGNVLRVSVLNDATDGIADTEINTGGDKMTLGVRSPSDTQTMSIRKIAEHNGGILILEVS